MGGGGLGHYIHGMCEHELALSALLCTRIQKEKLKLGGGEGEAPKAPEVSTPWHTNVLVHTTLDMFVRLCTSLNVLGGVQNTTKAAASHSY